MDNQRLPGHATTVLSATNAAASSPTILGASTSAMGLGSVRGSTWDHTESAIPDSSSPGDSTTTDDGATLDISELLSNNGILEIWSGSSNDFWSILGEAAATLLGDDLELGDDVAAGLGDGHAHGDGDAATNHDAADDVRSGRVSPDTDGLAYGGLPRVTRSQSQRETRRRPSASGTVSAGEPAPRVRARAHPDQRGRVLGQRHQPRAGLALLAAIAGQREHLPTSSSSGASSSTGQPILATGCYWGLQCNPSRGHWVYHCNSCGRRYAWFGAATNGIWEPHWCAPEDHCREGCNTARAEQQLCSAFPYFHVRGPEQV